MMGPPRGGSSSGSAPAVGPRIPAATLHVGFLAVATGLCLLVLERPFWLPVGLLLAAGGTVLPERVSRWWVLLLLGVSQLGREPSVTDASFYLLLAGLHLLHVVGSLAQHVPWHARIQRRAFARGIRRFVLVQAVAQTVAGGALLALDGSRGTATGLSIVAAASLALMAALLARALRRALRSE